MSELFISYARADGSEFAIRLHDDLAAAGFATWLDQRDLRGGVDWDAEIDEALDRSTGVLVVMTLGALASHPVKSEYLEALTRLLPVVPLLARPSKVPRMLTPLHHVNFVASYAAGLGALIDHLRDLGKNHLRSLERTLEALRIAQEEAPDPRRFQTKIDGLEARIAGWDERAQAQRQRVAVGQEENRHRVRGQQVRQAARVPVVGRQPQDVTEYFRDREDERAEIARLLAAPGARLVSVIGRSGMGKTAVALKVLQDLERSRWPHAPRRQDQPERPVAGIVYLSSRTAGISLERIFSDVARLLGGEREAALERTWRRTQLSTADKVERLFEALGEELYVLLLDNLEDNLDRRGRFQDEGLEQFFDLALTARHRARLLVTSREPIFPTRDVMLHEKRVELDRGLPVDDAVELLRELDQNGRFGLRKASAEDLGRLAEAVYRIPRALEVAAGILAGDPFLSVTDLTERFYDKPDAAKLLIEEGYRRLDDEGRRVLEALAVLRRSVRVIAVDVLLEPFVEGLDVPRVAARLARHHLVHINRNDGALSLHPIDRKFAYSRLPEEGAYRRQALELRAAEYYEDRCDADDSWESVADLESRVRQIEHLMHAGAHEEASRVLSRISLWMSWYGFAPQARGLHQQLDGKIDDPQLLVRHLQGLASTHTVLGPLDEALATCRRAVALARRIGGGPALADLLVDLGLIHRYLGQLDDAREHYLEGLEICRATPGDYPLAVHLRQLGRISAYMGRVGDCRRYAAEALEIDAAAGDRLNEGVDASIGALADWMEPRYESMEELYRRALALLEETGERNTIGYVLNGLGLLHLARGSLNEAEEFLQKARAQGRDDEQPRVEAFALFNLTWLHCLRHETESALEAARESQKILATLQAPEARTAERLAAAIEAGAGDSGDRARAAPLLLACALAIGTHPDLYDPRKIAHAAIELARAEGADDVAVEAARFVADYEARLIRA